MGEVIRTTVDTALLKREPFQRMVFAGTATADAYIVVFVVSVLIPLLFVLDLVGLDPLNWLSWIVALIAGAANAGFRWLIAAGLFWYVSTNMLDGGGRYHAGLPVVGFAHTPLLLIPFITRFTALSSPVLVYLVPAAWGILIMSVGAQAVYDVPREKAMLAGLAGAFGYFLALVIFRI